MGLNRLVPVFLVLFLCGCATTPYSVPLSKAAREETPGKGIPYYLPHPYLVVTKNLNFVVPEKTESKSNQNTESTSGQNTANQSSGKNSSSDKSGSSGKNNASAAENAASDNSGKDSYSMQVVYLPDYSQKYALYYNRGVGKYDSTVTLVDGWKMTGLNTSSDTKTAEIIQAIGSSVKDIASGAAAAGATFKSQGVEVEEEEGEEASKPAVPAETSKTVGIWIYDLGGDKPFKSVFSWPE